MELFKFSASPALSDREINLFLTRRFAAARTPWGRWWLTALVACKQALWHWEISSAAIAKRAFDIVASLAAIILLSPLLLLIAFLVRRDGGPALFRQTRVGKYGREFSMIKFRSMCLDAEARLQALLAQNTHAEGVTFKLKNDPRITPVGRWLRKLSFDELPQFFNVLMGDMSLVGPRPPLPREVALYSAADRRRLAVKPGITCLWQISGRADIDFSGQVRLDVSYIENQNFWKDVQILVLTGPAVISGKGAS